MNTKTSKRARRPKLRLRPDYTSGKKYPNGISSTVLAMQQFWLAAAEGKKGPRFSRPQFLSKCNFLEVFDQILKKYPGDRQETEPSKSRETLVNDLIFGRHDLSYVKLRTLADFVNLPAGLFVLFTQCVSLEREVKQEGGHEARLACLPVIEGLQRVVDCMKARLHKSQPDGDVFMERYDTDEDSYLPSMEMLKAWSDAYNNRKK
jgi:hypothetical protein